jgi:hypothetical protein
VVPIPAQWGDAEHGLVLVVLHGERGVAHIGGWFPTVVPPSAG